MSPFVEVHGVAIDRSETFPYSGMRVLGSIQIVIGILVFILGVVDLALTLFSYKTDLDKYGSSYEIVLVMTMVSSPLWCGMWFSVTGGLGTCMTRDRVHSLHFYKICFLILNVLCCGLFGPICACITGLISYNRHGISTSDFQWLITLIICFLAVIEAVMATVSAAVTCCCSTLRSAQVHIIVNPRDLIGNNNEATAERPSSNVDARSHSNSTNNFKDNADPINKNNVANSNSRNSLNLPTSQKNSPTSNPRYEKPSLSPTNDVNKYYPRQHPRIEIQEPIIDGFGFTSGYEHWKKWAIQRSGN